MDSPITLVLLAAGAGLALWFATKWWRTLAQRWQQRILREAADSLPLLMFAKDGNGRFLYANPAFAQFLGRTPEPIAGAAAAEVYPPEATPAALAEDREILLSGHPREREETLEGGRLAGAIVRTRKIRYQVLARPPVVLGFLEDLTALRQAELELARERDFIHAVLDSAEVFVMVVGRQGRIVQWNRACERRFGYTLAEVQDPAVAQSLITPEDRAGLADVFPARWDNPDLWRYTTVCVAKDGTRLPVSWVISIIGEGGEAGQLMVAVGMDLSVLRKSEEQLEQMRSLHQLVWESAADPMVLLSKQGVILAANPAFARLADVVGQGLVGLRLTDLLRPAAGAPDAGAPPAPLELAEVVLPSGEKRWLDIASSWVDEGGESPQLLRVLRDATERVKRQQELEAANEFLETTTRWAREMAASAELASAAKNEFMANVSHEIRTPMNGILGMTDLALLTDLTAEQREYLTLVKSSAESLLQLLDDLLDLSRAEAGRVVIAVEAFALRERAGDLMRTLAPRAAERAVALTMQIEPEVPDWLSGDWGRIRQVLSNLVGNALKFTDHGVVHLEIARLPSSGGAERIQFRVSDTGIGMAPERIAEAFEPFTQLDGSSTRRRGGTGLGLSISEQLVELMGGRLYVGSEPGSGSMFCFTLPLLRGTAEERVPAGAAVDIHAERPLRILVAEDNQVNQRLVIRMLERLGHSPVLAVNGRDVLEKARADRFDAILMDVQMPEMDGLEATSRLRIAEKSLGCRTPIIAMTAHAAPSDRQACLDVGMDWYLSKPLRLQDLAAVLNRWCGTSATAPKGDREMETAPKLNREEALARVGGDEQLLAELVGLFLQEYPQLLEALQSGVEREDWAAAAVVAHQLRGLLAQFGADESRETAYQTEQAGRAGDGAGCAELARQLAREIEELRPSFAAVAGAASGVKPPERDEVPRPVPAVPPVSNGCR